MRQTRYLADPTPALALAGIFALTPIQTPATEAASPLGAADQASALHVELLDGLHQQIQELKGRVQGMEGKLRESAISRKGADQARMEAERRLAEQLQEVDRLRQERTALKSRIAKQEAEISQLNASNQDLEAKRDALANRVAEHEAEADRLERELQISNQSRIETEARVTELLNRLPSSEGGSLTPAAARAAATAAFDALQKSHQQARHSPDPSSAKGVQTAEDELHRRQLKLANAISAQCVYRIRAKDTLGQISKRFYGSSAQWHRLFEANRHLLEDPNRLDPGITLVIP
ncbi:LysM peptidoglycan-binding domain-containing protein [Imhoffiella purpurea]|uniref:LysM domain-containing protein n=1 Tax=Imhoffiella purpurea TaxID=1249627 RepID=W9VV72_9GAMM|nr:LysM peptidoglycan-binding domain-containing protein [Imhoffiella purpurea]EXJ14300.1 hypothetical protein D779_2775 [Imhoffiella purpurea]